MAGRATDEPFPVTVRDPIDPNMTRLENPRHPLLSPVGATMGRCPRWGWLRAELGLGVPGSAEPQLGVGRGETLTFIIDLADQGVGVCDGLSVFGLRRTCFFQIELTLPLFSVFLNAADPPGLSSPSGG
jgi:hypothetical protein